MKNICARCNLKKKMVAYDYTKCALCVTSRIKPRGIRPAPVRR